MWRLKLALWGIFAYFAMVSSLHAHFCGNVDQTKYYAWFVDKERPVHYCIQRSEDFPISQKEAKSSIEDAAQIWSTYYVTQGIKTDFQYALNFVYSEICNSNVDLKFYLGMNPPEVQNAPKKPDFYSFSHETTYDEESSFGKGFVWFAPGFSNWTMENVFKAVVLHHIGHMLGTGHVPGTVMLEEGLPSITSEMDEAETAKMSVSINQNRNLLVAKDANGIVKEDEFMFLSGRRAQGKIFAALKINDKKLAKERRITTAHLRLSDDVDTFIIPMTLFLNNRTVANNYPAFAKRVDNGSRSTSSNGYFVLGTLTRNTGEVVPISLSQNLDSDLFGRAISINRIDTLANNSVRSFSSLLPYEY